MYGMAASSFCFCFVEVEDDDGESAVAGARVRPSRFPMYVVRMPDTAMPPRMHITGASTSIRRTITPEK